MKTFIDPAGQHRGHDERKSVTPVRAWCVLVVSDLKSVLRVGDVANGWLQSWHDQACVGWVFAWLATGLAFKSASRMPSTGMRKGDHYSLRIRL